MLMRDDALVNETCLDQLPKTVEEVPSPPLEPAPPITSRFLLVNVAARGPSSSARARCRD